jgi:GNAT superfamily N-acetyltransferase
MVAYRFCRPDDIPRLVDAVNCCYSVHFPGQAPFTVEEFRREMKEVQLWPSNCMIASAGEEAAAVVLGTKRPREVLVRRIGVAPGHQRRGYGGHLLGSLSQKLAVLGPPRLVAEVPAAMEDACAFFGGVGWHQEAVLRDYERPAAIGHGPLPEAAFARVTVGELDGMGVLKKAVAWERQPESLAAGEIEGLAICGSERLEAWALFRHRLDGVPAGARGADVVELGYAEPARAGAALALLCSRIEDLTAGPLRLRWVEGSEHPPGLLAMLAFRPTATTLRFATEAAAA